MDIKYLAGKFYDSYKTKESLKFENYKNVGLNEKSAYELQHVLNSLRKGSIKAYKVSLTSKETQDMFNYRAPLYGEEIESSILNSGDEIALEQLFSPFLEVELQFIAKEDLLATDDSEVLISKTDIAAGFEIPDCRFDEPLPKMPIEFMIADCAGAGKIVSGKPKVKLTVEKLAQVNATLKFNGKEISKGNSSAVLGNPINSLKWLVDKLKDEGKSIKKGMIVSTGAFGLPIKLKKGVYTADFDHGVGSVTIKVK